MNGYGDDKEMITSREMRALELNSEYYGVSRLQLMENAGRSVAAELASRFKPKEARVVVFCGSGGNGGDGFVVARHLTCFGFKVEVILAGRSADIVDKEARRNWLALQALKDIIPLHEVYDSTLIPSLEADVVVDALLGIGLKGTLRPPILQLVRKINEMKAFCVAVDVPTGINSDSGEVFGDAVKADLTVVFHETKPGLTKAKEYAGEIIVRDIGLPKEFERFAGPGDVSSVVKPRPPEAHKGDFGRLLVIGGSEVFSGAPALVAFAALRAGVDLTYIAAPEKTARAISSMSPDLITVKLEGEHLNPRNAPTIKRYLETSTAVVMGPGLGLHKETKDAVKEIIKLVGEEKTPLLLDADGLKAFAEFKGKLKCPLVLTPHAGEYQILTGKKLPKDLEKRTAEMQKTARELGAVILLKGRVDVISDGKRVKLNFTGNPGMTVGGTGDVLSGIVGTFLAQGADPFEAAVAGAFINGAAGDFVHDEKGYHMVPTDLLEWIPRVMDDPMSHLKVRKSAS
ncbi:MAG: Hydroxyethylthiazole kinase [Candidatus Bathyarchaeota archaeon BA2]|nr:MAG: Hydroxyethylthiazole kinase [Candidatus Bathyarchaeota archaeon BA2]